MRKLSEIIDREEVHKLPAEDNPYDISEFIDNCEVAGIDVFRNTNSASIRLVSTKPAGFHFMESLGKYIREKTNLDEARLSVKFVGCDISGYFTEIIKEIVFLDPNQGAFLNGSTAAVHDGRLDVKLNNNGADILYLKKTDAMIEKIIRDKFDRALKVKFLSEHADKAKKQHVIIEAPAVKNRKKVDTIISGKTIKTEPTEISSAVNSDESVTVTGEVFNFSLKTLNNSKHICSFGLTDRKSSVYVKIMLEDKNGITALDDGEPYVKVRGRMQFDTYLKDKVLMAKDISLMETQERKDEAPEKRTELHVHTQMSAMDGISDTAKLIKRAAEWGHKAIAITDHGVLHAYPDAYEASKKYGIKVIYGLEGYLVDNNNLIVGNADKRDINCQYTVIDIETTGLSVKYDRITEIGAVKFKDGQILNTYSSLVNPGMAIPVRVSELTGITDRMVSESQSIEEVLPEFLDFIGDDCLVAHNASFDISILKREVKKLGRHISNPVLDTLELSKLLLPDLKRNKLSSVARKLNVKTETRHRALGDAMTAALVLRKFFEIIKYRTNIRTLDEIESLAEEKINYRNAKEYHIILLARNKTGLKNLYKIVSASHMEYFHKHPRIPKSLLSRFREGILAGSACSRGEVYQAILENREEEELVQKAEFYDYLEIQPVSNNMHLIDDGLVKDIEQLENINKKIMHIGDLAQKKTVATSDAHIIDREDNIFRDIILTGNGFENQEKQPPIYFRNTNEMMNEFSYLGEERAHEAVISNTSYISSLTEEIAPVPEGKYPPKIKNSDSELTECVYDKAREIYGDRLPDMIGSRIEKELGSIIKHGFSVMYIIARKLVMKSIEDGFLVGSRGSVGSSFVAFLAGITEVNSLPPHYICNMCKHIEFHEDPDIGCGFDLPDELCPECKTQLTKDGYDIPFETFLGFDGDKAPDIDLNFSGLYQARAHKYIEEMFGKECVFRAGTVSKLASQTAYGYVMKYIESKNLVLSKCETERLTEGCMGVRKTTGQHPGGIMIIPDDMEIYDFTAIGYPADDIGSGKITTHFDYRFLHDSILKLDILGHDDPTMLNMLEGYTGKKASEIKIGDRKVMEIFRGTEAVKAGSSNAAEEIGTLGIPEFGTSFVRSMLLETKPETYAELIKISGLSHGENVWIGNAQKLIKENTATLKNSICCRDDIMIYLIHKGVIPASAFRIMENVRKGKGLSDDMVKEMKACKVPDWYIWSCGQIKYMFPKAHAAAYVSMAFRIAWYKVNEPLAYYAAYFSTRSDEFDSKMMMRGSDVAAEYLKQFKNMEKTTQREKNIITILEVVLEMYERGYEFLPVDIYISDARDFKPENGRIRPPLRSIAGLGDNVANNIVKERKNGKFLSAEDLSLRTKATKAIVDSMEEEGCLKGLPASNQLSLF